MNRRDKIVWGTKKGKKVTSRNFKMAAMETLFDHLIVSINAKMTTYVYSSYTLSSVMFSHIY